MRNPVHGGMISLSQAKQKQLIRQGWKELAKINPAFKKMEKVIPWRMKGGVLTPTGGVLYPTAPSGGMRTIRRPKKMTSVRGGKRKKKTVRRKKK